MPSIYDRIYANAPVWLQNIGVSAYGIVWRQRRYGGRFREYVNQFVSREAFSEDNWDQYQTERLRSLLYYAGKNVPYYQKLFQQIGLSLQELANFKLSDLPKLPLLEKEYIRSNPDQFIALSTRSKRFNTYLTSGTTGTPLAIKWTVETDRLNQAAYEARVRRWAGLDYTMSRAMIGGRMVVPKADAPPPYWRYNLIERQLYMSAFHISPANVRDYVDALNRFRPDYLVGYASSHFFLARMIEELKLRVYQPKAVLTSSEKLTPEMRSVIENVYRCPVFDAYSGVEGSCLVSECEYHRLHISPDVGIVEILGEDGKNAVLGELGEVITTGLLNFEQPLVRYRMGDLATLSATLCPCGRKMPVIQELVGRLEDVVIGHDGREVVRFHGIFVGLPHIREGQVIQETRTRFRLRLVVDPGFSDEERKIINQRFHERLGNVDVLIEEVERIERTERGKFRAVISHVDRNDVDVRGE